MFRSEFWRHFDFWLLGAVIVALVFGVTMIRSAVAGNENAQDSRRESAWYQIRVRGHLSPDWSDWFEGLELELLENGEMILCGPIADQAALIGVLTR